MTTLTMMVDELKRLPPGMLDRVARYVYRLKEKVVADRNAVIDETAGCLRGEAGESFARAIEEGCERVDVDGW